MVLNPPTFPGDRRRPVVRTVVGKAGIADRRRSTCSRCRAGIFTGQAVEWSRDPLGLVHSVCPDPPGGVLDGIGQRG